MYFYGFANTPRKSVAERVVNAYKQHITFFIVCNNKKLRVKMPFSNPTFEGIMHTGGT